MKRFVILGGNFQNTGAQAMTFVTVDALKKKFGTCEIVMLSTSPRDPLGDIGNYAFRVSFISDAVFRRESSGSWFAPKFLARGMAKRLLGRGDLFKERELLKSLLRNCDGAFDVSGYALSSQIPDRTTILNLDRVDLFTGHGIPYYYLPQSFGPFDYGRDKESIIGRLKATLPKAKTIFVREDEGYRMLADLIGERNLVRSCDMVLQSKEIDKRNIYRDPPRTNEIGVDTRDNVAVIPNIQNFIHGDKDRVLSLYGDIIKVLLSLGKNVYLVSHSAVDISACGDIKALFPEEGRVRLIGDKIDSWTFDSLIRHFDFAVASRFHSIVHSYRAGTPCISLGWATKYRELLKSLDQQDYMIDVRELSGRENVEAMVLKMNENHAVERDRIRARLAAIMETGCFDLITL